MADRSTRDALPEVRGAVQQGRLTRPAGDGGWIYSRSRSRSDVSPLIAAAVALAVADLELERAGSTKIVIH